MDIRGLERHIGMTLGWHARTCSQNQITRTKFRASWNLAAWHSIGKAKSPSIPGITNEWFPYFLFLYSLASPRQDDSPVSKHFLACRRFWNWSLAPHKLKVTYKALGELLHFEKNKTGGWGGMPHSTVSRAYVWCWGSNPSWSHAWQMPYHYVISLTSFEIRS